MYLKLFEVSGIYFLPSEHHTEGNVMKEMHWIIR
jgi:hypothetical protein